MRAKKSLGQNFLKSKKAIAQIADAGGIRPEDTVLEVGPGKGVLTEELLARAGRVIAIEKDRDLVPLLREKFARDIASGKLELIESDILDFDETALAEPYKVVANIPYYITGLLFRKFLESTNQPETMVFLVQKEVADRIMARDGKESLLSISIKAYGTPKYIAKVGKEYFSPSPKVDSAIVSVQNISNNAFSDTESAPFFDVLHAGFAHKRKKLASNLKEGMLGTDPARIDGALAACSIAPNARAEELGIDSWICLAKELA